MQTVKRIFLPFLGFILLWGVWSSLAWGADVYVVYAGKHKGVKTQLLKVFPKDLSVKTYNVDLLAVSDYSGKQKVLAKFGTARVVVILLDASMQVLRGSTVKADLMIVESVETTVKSDLWTLYVVSKGTDLSKLGKAVKLLNATKPADLVDAEVIRSSQVVIVDEKTFSVFGAVSLIAERVLRL